MSNKCPYAFVKNLTDLAYCHPYSISQEFFNGDDVLTIEIKHGVPHYFLEIRGVFSPDGSPCLEPSPSELIDLLRGRI